MCRVNDQKRNEYTNQINNLTIEYEAEEAKLIDLKKAKNEVQQLVEEAQCVINNIGDCDLGGDAIMSSITTSQRGYLDRIDYYDEYTIKCKNTQESISEEINVLTRLASELPANCGSCEECNPPISITTLN